jgi:uncharacterized alpha-E superfamily protein
MERCSFVLRVARTQYVASQDDPHDRHWLPLLRGYLDLPQRSVGTAPSINRVLQSVILDREHVASVFNNVTRARDNARAVQDHITKEMWQCLNDYHHVIREERILNGLTGGDPITVLDELLRHAMLYHGVTDSTMARGESNHFLNIGKFLERAVLGLSLIEHTLEAGYDTAEQSDVTGWRSLLFSLSGFEIYMKTYRGGIQPNAVVELALQNPLFPNSCMYCLDHLVDHIEGLPADSGDPGLERMRFLVGKARHVLKYDSVSQPSASILAAFLVRMQQEFLAVAHGCDEWYFGAK